MGRDPQGVLVTGVYGAGKSAVAAELAHILEREGIAYGAIDLDWLTWFEAPDMERANEVCLRNVASVVGNYVEVGVERLVLAGAVRDATDVALLEEAAGVPLSVVRLEASRETIVSRLTADPTTGRRDDLEEAMRWLDGGVGTGFEDLVLTNDSVAVQEVAQLVVDWLGWLTD